MMIAKHDSELDIVIVEDPTKKLEKIASEERNEETEREIQERFNYYRNGGHLGPTGHGDICYSDADPGL